MRTRLGKRLLNQVGRASRDHRMIEPGDRVMVGISGGKDSWTLLRLLRETQRRVPFDMSIVAVNLDQGHPGFPADVIEDYLRGEGYEYRMLKQDTYKVVLEKVPEGKTYCSLCSRLRRGILYNAAQDLGATKIALGHHTDDVIETLMLNLLYSGQIKAMPAKLHSDDGRNTIIRPLVYCSEADIAAFAEEMKFPIIPCNLCGTQVNMQRQNIKALIADLQRSNPNVRGNLFASLFHVRPTHLFDKQLRTAFGLDDGGQSTPGASQP